MDSYKDIVKKQLDYINTVAVDIMKNNHSYDVLKYASIHVHVEINGVPFEDLTDDKHDITNKDLIRVDLGELYAYIGNEISLYADEAGLSGNTYESLIKELALMDESEMEEREYSWCYEEEDRKNYVLNYTPFNSLN